MMWWLVNMSLLLRLHHTRHGFGTDNAHGVRKSSAPPQNCQCQLHVNWCPAVPLSPAIMCAAGSYPTASKALQRAGSSQAC